jgi:hypothetical protein
MLSRFERAMAALSMMLVKARAPIGVSDDHSTPGAAAHRRASSAPGTRPVARLDRPVAPPARRFHAFADVSANTPTLSRTWRQFGDWLSGHKAS